MNYNDLLRNSAFASSLRRGESQIRALASGSIELLAKVTENILARGYALVVDARLVHKPLATQVLVPTVSLIPNAATVRIASAAPLTLTGEPVILPGIDGQIVHLINVGAETITLPSDTDLLLTAATISLPTYASVRLQYVELFAAWVQVAPVVVISV